MTSLTANQKAVPAVEATIAVEHTDAPIIRCTARAAFTVNNAHVAAGEVFYLVRSERRSGRYYVVRFNTVRNQYQCSCGANCKEHAHLKVAKSYANSHVVRPQVQEIEQQSTPQPAPAASNESVHEYDLSQPITAEQWREIHKRDQARQKAEKAVDWQRIEAARASVA